MWSFAAISILDQAISTNHLELRILRSFSLCLCSSTSLLSFLLSSSAMSSNSFFLFIWDEDENVCGYLKIKDYLAQFLELKLLFLVALPDKTILIYKRLTSNRFTDIFYRDYWEYFSFEIFLRIFSPAQLQLKILLPPLLFQSFCFVQVIFHLCQFCCCCCFFFLIFLPICWSVQSDIPNIWRQKIIHLMYSPLSQE